MFRIKNQFTIIFQAIHEGQDCKQYQLSLLEETQDENSAKTKVWIEVPMSKTLSTFLKY